MSPLYLLLSILIVHYAHAGLIVDWQKLSSQNQNLDDAVVQKTSVTLSGIKARLHSNPFHRKSNIHLGTNLRYDSLLFPSPKSQHKAYGLLANNWQFDLTNKTIAITVKTAYFSDGTPLHAKHIYQSLHKHLSSNYNMQALATHHNLQIKTHSKYQLQLSYTHNMPINLLRWLSVLPIGKDTENSAHHPPIGSGPYLHDQQLSSRSQIVWKIRDHYWAKNDIVGKIRCQYEQIAFHYYPNHNRALQQFLLRRHNIHHEDFAENRIILEKQPQLNTYQYNSVPTHGMSGWFFNLNKTALQDPKTRQALNILFPFTAINQAIFASQYQRLEHYFSPNNSNGSSQDSLIKHIQLLKADQLLRESGWILQNGRRIHSRTQKPLQLDLLISSAEQVKIANIYAENCKHLGIQIHPHLYEHGLYHEKVKNKEFDLAYWNITLNNIHSREIEAFELAIILEKIKTITTATDLDALKKNTDKLTAEAKQQLDQYIINQHYCIPFWQSGVQKLYHWQDEPPSAQIINLLTAQGWKIG